jgi:hypothetical protein
MGTPLAVCYQVGGDDCLTGFNDGWTTFAEANGGGALLPGLIRGRSLCEFVSDPTTAYLYRAMMKRLRAGAHAIEFEIRCDSPDRRRQLRMEIAGAPGGVIAFTATSVREETRPPVAVLDVTRERTDDLLAVCAWCMRARLSPGTWVDIESAVRSLDLFLADQLPRLTHGMCESCLEAMLPLAERSGGARDAMVRLGPLGERKRRPT